MEDPISQVHHPGCGWSTLANITYPTQLTVAQASNAETPHSQVLCDSLISAVSKKRALLRLLLLWMTPPCHSLTALVITERDASGHRSITCDGLPQS